MGCRERCGVQREAEEVGFYGQGCLSECCRDMFQVAFQETILEALAAGLKQGGA